MELGWIKLHRKIKDNPVLKRSKTYSNFEAFIWLLLKANYDNAKVVIGSNIYRLKQGELITSQKKLCRKFGWGNSRLRTFLKLLEKDGMIKYKSNTQLTQVRLLNWCSYQDAKLQTNSSQTDTKYQTKTENKKERKIKNKEEIRLFNDWWCLYDKKVGKTKSENYWVKNIKKQDIEAITEHTKKYIKTRSKQYRKNPHSYLLNKTWEDEIVGDENTKAIYNEHLKEKESIREQRYKNQKAIMEKENEQAPNEDDWEEIKETLTKWSKK